MERDKKESEIEQLYRGKAERYCIAGEQCSYSVREKMKQWGVPKDIAESVIEYLTENQYIDDVRYSDLYCESKVRLQKWGRRKIAAQLRQKQIDNETIERSLEKIDNNLYKSILMSLAASKWTSLRKEEMQKRRAKTASYLAQRGFTQEEIYEAMRELPTEEMEME